MPKYSKQIQELPKKNQEFPKHSRITKKFPRFWKYPIPYIALGGPKPFRACFVYKGTYQKYVS